MFVYIVDRNSTFIPKAYQHISVTFAFQSHLVGKTEEIILSGMAQSPHAFPFISSHGVLLTRFLLLFM
jgi:hypothetical protein